VGVIASLAVFFVLQIARPGGASAPIDFAALGLALTAAWALMPLKWSVVQVIATCAALGLARHFLLGA
jgi:chromate transporter